MNKNWLLISALIAAIAISVAVFMYDTDSSVKKLFPYLFGGGIGFFIAVYAKKS